MPSPISERPSIVAAKLDTTRREADDRLAKIEAASARANEEADVKYAVDVLPEDVFSPEVELAFLVLKAQVERDRAEKARVEAAKPAKRGRAVHSQESGDESLAKTIDQLRDVKHLSGQELLQLIRLALPEGEKSKIHLSLSTEEVQSLSLRFSECFRSKNRRAALLERVYSVLGQRSEASRRSSVDSEIHDHG